MRKEKDVLYVYAEEDTKEYVNTIAKKYNERLSVVVNEIIRAYRDGRKLAFMPAVPKYVRQAELWKSKHGKG